MMRKVLIGCAAAVLLAGINWLAYRAATHSHADAWKDTPQSAADAPLPVRDGAIELPWPLLERTTIDAKAHTVAYPENLKACVGKRVRLTGVVCVLPNLVVDGKVTACVLQPPSKIACCGITCDPRPELMVLVDCKANSFAPPSERKMAVVTGELELESTDSSWCLYTLNGAELTWLP